LNATVTAANVPEVTQVLTGMPAVGGKPGRRRQRPRCLQGDRGYDSGPVRRLLRWLGITPVLAARYRGHGSGLGVFRWFVERTISWLHQMGQLRRRLNRLAKIQEAFLRLGCARICLRVACLRARRPDVRAARRGKRTGMASCGAQESESEAMGQTRVSHFSAARRELRLAAIGPDKSNARTVQGSFSIPRSAWEREQFSPPRQGLAGASSSSSRA
jgi:hypothetical protein